MKKKALLIFLLIISPFIFFHSCKQKPVKVGVLMHSLSHERWGRDKLLLAENIEALGGEVLFRIANDNQGRQNNQARELIQAGVDVLVVIPADQNQAADIVRMAHKKDIQVVAYDRLIMNSDLDFYISTSSVRVGELQARYMTSIVPKGNYGLIIGAKSDNNALLLFVGQMNELQHHVESGNIRVVYSEYTDSWSSEEGYRAMSTMLAENDSLIDVVIAGSDELAYGVHQALEEANLLGKVRIASQDADLKIVQEIVKGNHTATIYKPLGEMAKKTAEIAIKLAKEEKIRKNYTTVSNGKNLVPSYELEPILVNKDNISSTVVAAGYHRSEEIF